MPSSFGWRGGKGVQDGLPMLLRLRDVSLTEAFIQRYPHLVSIKRRFNSSDPSRLPSNEQYDEIGRFESNVLDPLEDGEVGVLALTRTHDSAIEYILYVRDLDQAIGEIKTRTDPATIELSADEGNLWEEYRAAVSAIIQDGGEKRTHRG